MELTDLPNELQTIVHEYKHSAEYHEKFSCVLGELNQKISDMWSNLYKLFNWCKWDLHVMQVFISKHKMNLNNFQWDAKEMFPWVV